MASLCLRLMSKATNCCYYASQVIINSSRLTMTFRKFSFQGKRSVYCVSNLQPSRRIALTSVRWRKEKSFQNDHPERVFLVDETSGNQGEMSFEQALQLAKDKSLELVRMNRIGKDESVVPVFKLMSTDRDANARPTVRSLEVKPLKIKTVKVTDKIESQDLFFKIKRIEGYLEKGYRVRLFVKDKKRGNEESTSDDKLNIIKQIQQELKVNHTTERPTEEGKGVIVCVFKPA